MKLLFLTIITLFSIQASAQTETYEDLKVLYAEGKFEKLIDKAEKYTMKEKTKKDPNAYIWLTKGFYKLHLSGETNSYYPNPYKEALGSMIKAVKYDTDSINSAQEEHFEFVNEFTMATVDLITTDALANDFKKAAGWNTKYQSIAKDKAGAIYMTAVCKYKAGDKGGAGASWKEADLILTKIESINSWRDADKKLLRIAVMCTADCLISGRQTEKAKELMNRFAPWFDAEADFKAKYDEIIN